MAFTEFKHSGYFSVYYCRREPIEKRQQKAKKKQQQQQQTRAQRRASLKTLNVVNGCSVF